MEGNIQFKVPQNIDMEDKIIGPLTLIQFIYLMAGGALFYIMLKAGNTTLLVFVGIPAALCALFLAFIKINDQPFSKFVVSLMSYMARPKQRAWRKEMELEGTPDLQNIPQARAKAAKPLLKAVEKSDLEKLALILDTKGWSGVSTDSSRTNTDKAQIGTTNGSQKK